MNKQQSEILRGLYQNYNQIKPLIAEVEVRSQKFPLPVFNEIRAFNDHIARCYLDDIEEKRIDVELSKAQTHITRIILDLYKYLIVFLDDEIKRFEHQTKNLDLTKIGSGEFYSSYRQNKKQALDNIRQSKSLENQKKVDFSEIVRSYEKAYNDYSETVRIIESNLGPIDKLRVNIVYEPIKKTFLSTAKWILLTIVSSIISILLTIWFFDSIKEWINNL